MVCRTFAFLLSLCAFLIAEVEVSGTVDSRRIAVDETINFKVMAQGSDGYPQLDILQIKDFTVISGPAQSSSFQWINGQMSSSKSLSWTLIPNRTGNLHIPTLEVTVDRRIYRLDPISITVVPSRRERPGGDRETETSHETETPLIFLEAEADKKEAYQGEQITVQYKLYTRVNLRQYSMEKKPQGIGFWLEELYTPKQPSLRETRVDGVRYQVATLYRTALFPTKAGQLVVDPMVLSCTIEAPSRSRIPSLFDDFFSDRFFSRTEQRIVRSEPLNFQIRPVPEEGRPASYSGAVGEFFIRSSLDTAQTEANQAISYTIELSGTGNLSLFQIEEPIFPAGLEVFTPKRTFEKDPFRDEITGTKRLEYVIIPRREGRFLIPESKLDYFNPETGKWESTSIQVSTVTVLPSSVAMEQGQGLTKEEIALLGQDIRYIRTTGARWRAHDQRVIPNVFWLFGVLGLMLFASPTVIVRLRRGRDDRIAETRARTAFRKAKRSLKKIKDPGRFSDVISVIYSYFADKFDVPAAGLNAHSLEKFLLGEVDAEDINSLTEIISICLQARYSPVDHSKLGNDAVGLARCTSELLQRIERAL